MTASHIQDLDDVRALIGLYVDGANGDGDKMREAFHPDARMFGHIGEMDTYEPITDFTALVEANPGLAGPDVSRGTSAASTSSATQVWRCWWSPTTSAATSSTSSRWRASTAAGGSPARRTPTPAAPHRRCDPSRGT